MRKFDISELMTLPTIAAQTPSSLVSGKYTMASTKGILDVFEGQGWTPVDYRERSARVVEKIGKQLHTVILANPELEKGLAVSTTLPRIMLKNSHDGSSTLCLLSGLFERICANGLVVGARASDIKVRHVGLTSDAVVSAINTVLSTLESSLRVSEEMKRVRMDKQQQLKLAQDAIDMVWEDGLYTVRPESLLTNHRREQCVPNLWNTFNTIQERIIRGGVRQYRADGSKIHSREVRSIDRSIKINRCLWDIAECHLTTLSN